jgi:NADPH-dependent 2,4-dienoyl-CoA reductase/sulfur reductase-like enzyme
VVVVGGSLAGVNTVQELRRLGFAGEVVLVDDEGAAAYDRPPLSKQVLVDEVAPKSLRLVEPDRLATLARVVHARAEALDLDARRVTVGGGEPIAYDRLVIATGAAARPLPAVPRSRYLVLRTLADARALRRRLTPGARLVVVGGGFIGSEVAAAARSRGVSVTILEAGPAPLDRVLGPVAGDWVTRVHRRHGTAVRGGAAVVGIEPDGARYEVRLADGGSLAADAVVVGIGAVPNVDWLASSGLACEDGVVCDPTCTASAPEVLAAGDVARWWHVGLGRPLRVEHWDNAASQGRQVARNLLLPPERRQEFAPVPYFWSHLYGHRLQFVGHAEGYDECGVEVADPATGRLAARFRRSGEVTGVLTVDLPAECLRWRRRLADQWRRAPR